MDTVYFGKFNANILDSFYKELRAGKMQLITFTLMLCYVNIMHFFTSESLFAKGDTDCLCIVFVYINKCSNQNWKSNLQCPGFQKKSICKLLLHYRQYNMNLYLKCICTSRAQFRYILIYSYEYFNLKYLPSYKSSI